MGTSSLTNAAAVDRIDDAARERYATDGYLLLERFVEGDELAELQAVAAEFVEQSRHEEASGRIFDLEPDHSADRPRLRRLNSPVDCHEVFARFALEGSAAQLAQAVLGGPVRYHHSKLNFKWADGGAEVAWHQDIQFWPHTDFSPLTIGVYLDDVDDEMGPMGVVPGSHRGPLHDLYDDQGAWAGAMRPDDVAELDLDSVVWLRGPAGSVTVHNCCMVHGSEPNRSTRSRPLLLQTYSAVGSHPLLGLGANGMTGPASGAVIGGLSEQQIEIDGRAMRAAPDWSGRGAPTIFGSQTSRTR